VLFARERLRPVRLPARGLPGLNLVDIEALAAAIGAQLRFASGGRLQHYGQLVLCAPALGWPVMGRNTHTAAPCPFTQVILPGDNYPDTGGLCRERKHLTLPRMDPSSGQC
jgi:hypothetical protein